MLIIANNLPEAYKNELLYHVSMQSRKMDVFEYPGSSWELGNQIGRMHMVAAILIHSPGDSKILEVVKEFNSSEV